MIDDKVQACSICKQDYKIDESITHLPCNREHAFHPKCINEYITEEIANQGQACCPLCKTHIQVQYALDKQSFEWPILVFEGRREEFLVMSEANLNATFFDAIKSGNYERVNELIESHRDIIHCRDKDTWTPLAWAVCENHADIVELLIEAGTDVKDTFRIHTAKSDLGSLLRASFFDSLRAARGNEKKEDTALHLVARGDLEDNKGKGSVEIAKLLFAAGAHINARDSLGRTPLRNALNNDLADLADFFKDKGAVNEEEGFFNLAVKKIFGK